MMRCNEMMRCKMIKNGGRIGLVAGLLAGVFLAGAPGVSAQGLMVTGYADLEASINGIGSDGDSEFFFDNHHFNILAIGKIYEDLFAAAEVEYEHAGEEIELEYGYLGYTGLKNTRFMAGKFVVPFGRFNKDIHATWINKMPDRPLGFKNVLPQTWSGVGLWASGGLPLGASGVRFAYDAFVINGLLGADGGDIRSFRGNDRDKQEGGRDNNKSVGGRIGLDFASQGVDFGVSAYTGNYSDDPGNDLNLTLFGADASWRYSGLEARAEVVTADQEATSGALRKTGAYGQLAYRLAPKWEPVVRYSQRWFPEDKDDLKRLSFGLSFYLKPSTSIRAAYHINYEKDGFDKENNQLVFQWNIVF